MYEIIVIDDENPAPVVITTTNRREPGSIIRDITNTPNHSTTTNRTQTNPHDPPHILSLEAGSLEEEMQQLAREREMLKESFVLPPEKQFGLKMKDLKEREKEVKKQVREQKKLEKERLKQEKQKLAAQKKQTASAKKTQAGKVTKLTTAKKTNGTGSANAIRSTIESERSEAVCNN
ncbi:unnamed protein product [Ambrosiozyma monospora]|uniref:Unnamed protein product n=1 Tax=Ambrosiozyma monospora TaxID=43982 RepID=A0ACB5T036_AMBMO|nr:unnamed protein product [Ambrosiozyma monospora]